MKTRRARALVPAKRRFASDNGTEGLQAHHINVDDEPRAAVNHTMQAEKHSELQRISELGLHLPAGYFRANLSDLAKRKFLLALECDLQGLDTEAWAFLKSEALQRVQAWDPKRGRQLLFDTLNEARGYNYLVSIGCKDIEFNPRATTETPDLCGFLGEAMVLCEVKTINKSDDEIERSVTGGVRKVKPLLPQEFLDKLSSVIQKASSQLLAFDKGSAARRIVCVVFNFDEDDYADEYQKQIEAYIARPSLPNIAVVLDFGSV